ncbi:hypothetical protein BH24CHL3_BH24CHL3_04150 [soil metagenome]
MLAKAVSYSSVAYNVAYPFSKICVASHRTEPRDSVLFASRVLLTPGPRLATNGHALYPVSTLL